MQYLRRIWRSKLNSMPDKGLTEEQVKLIEKARKAESEFVRSLVRPVLLIIALVGWLLFLFMIYSQGGGWDDIPLPFTVLVFSGWVWYFGERTISKAFTALKGQE